MQYPRFRFTLTGIRPINFTMLEPESEYELHFPDWSAEKPEILEVIVMCRIISNY